MLLEFLAQNIPHTKALVIFDSLGNLIEQKILENFNIYDNEIMQYVIADSKSLIKLVKNQKKFEFSAAGLIKDNTTANAVPITNKVITLVFHFSIVLPTK